MLPNAALPHLKNFRLEESIWSLDWILRGLHRQDMAIV
jgi:hypothetical protein